MTIYWYVDMKFARWVDLRQTNNLIDWLINNIIDVERDEIDWKDKICDVFNFWLIEMKTRMSNSNWLQRFLFWTNWIQLNQRLKSDWSVDKTWRKYFYLYRIQIFSRWFFCSFDKIWFSCCIATFAQNIFRKHWNDVFECMKKNVIDITWKIFSRRFLDRKKNFDLMI